MLLLVMSWLPAERALGMGPELLANGTFQQRGGEGKSPFAGWLAREWDGGQYSFSIDKSREGGTCAVITCIKQGAGRNRTSRRCPP